MLPTKKNATFTHQNSGSTEQDADFKQQESGLLQPMMVTDSPPGRKTQMGVSSSSWR